MIRSISAFLALLLFAGPLPAPESGIDDFFRAFTDEWMRFDTDAAAASRYFTGAEQDAFERRIAPRTEASRATNYRLVRKGLDQLRSFDRSKMTDAQRLSAEVMAWDLDSRIQGEPFRDYSFPFAQTYGAQSSLPSLLTVRHPVVTARDAENYVARLGQVAPRMEEAIAEARRLIAKKLVPPKFILEASLAQMRAFIATPPAQNPLVATFAERMKRVKELPGARQEEHRVSAERIVAEQIYPMWRKAIVLLEAEAPQATSDAGLWRFPNGVEAYNYGLARYTTTKMKAEEIHQTGLRMVARIEGQMDALLRQMGRADGSVKERMAKLQEDQPKFPATEQGRADYMADIEKTMRDAEKRAALLFDRIPMAPVVARPYPSFMGQRAASYNGPAPDGSRPGTFQFTFTPGRSKFSHSTIYHETVPGHHFQIALQLEDTKLPRFRQQFIFGGNSAFSEGWGLYAERLAAEYGWYEGDPEGQLDQLAQALFRARRLVVDTGLHAKRWTRQQAIDYGIRADEVDRYVVQPGQACAYMIGELKIVELRERAKRELVDKFSLREFHNVVLGTGMVPLEILEQQVDRYIRAKKG